MTNDSLFLPIPPPKYAIGVTVLALINHQPQYARIHKAYLHAQITLDEAGIFAENTLRWEYDVIVVADPIEESEHMVIAESTIFYEVHNDTDGQSA